MPVVGSCAPGRHAWLTVALDGRRDVLAQALVDVEHVQVNAAQLQNEGVTHSFTRPHISLQDAA